MKKSVVVALSGGVDSSVAAMLLKNKGYYVIGIYMNTNYVSCSSIEDSTDAMLVAHQ
jgi:tRNA-uridine 2-sulfurtransferase